MSDRDPSTLRINPATRQPDPTGSLCGTKATKCAQLTLEELCNLSMPELHQWMEATSIEAAEAQRKLGAFHAPYYDTRATQRAQEQRS